MGSLGLRCAFAGRGSMEPRTVCCDSVVSMGSRDLGQWEAEKPVTTVAWEHDIKAWVCGFTIVILKPGGARRCHVVPVTITTRHVLTGMYALSNWYLLEALPAPVHQPCLRGEGCLPRRWIKASHGNIVILVFFSSSVRYAITTDSIDVGHNSCHGSIACEKGSWLVGCTCGIISRKCIVSPGVWTGQSLKRPQCSGLQGVEHDSFMSYRAWWSPPPPPRG